MRNVKYIFFALMMVQVCFAQNSYDLTRLSSFEPVGTARFVGMGGAMSALGADVSTASTNPAGMGLYRSNDAVITFGMHNVENKSSFATERKRNDKFSFSVDNFGMVFSANLDDRGVKYVNLGFNYRHSNNFRNRKEIVASLIDENNNYFSQQYQLDNLYCISGDYYDYNDYYSLQYPWLGFLTSTSDLLDDEGFLQYVPEGISGLYPENMYYRSYEKGGVDDVDVNISCNIDDMMYFGVTLTASRVDYTRTSEYTEYCSQYDYYTIQNSYNVSGNGFGIKLGTILRPFEYSPFKVGFAIHTPTWYSLTDCTYATMIGAKGLVWDTRDYDAYGSELCVDYDYITPWRLNASASYTFGNSVAINAEYELVDYSTSKVEYNDGYDIQDLNDDIDNNMRATHIFRVGALFNVDDHLSFRCGYNYISAPHRKSAAKTALMVHDTSTEYMNLGETNIFTVGAGYAYDSFYFDLAYKYSTQKGDFYNYYDADYINPSVDVDVIRQSLVMSLGYRF